MALIARSLRLCLVTDPILCPGPILAETVAAAVHGGVTSVQLRDKDASTPERIKAACILKTVLDGSGITLLINDDLEAAIAADVDGIHIGQDDTSPTVARQRLGQGKIIGLSCETLEHVKAVDVQLIDYLGIGTVFPTATKSDHKQTIGLMGLTELVRLAPVPTVAIGGLKAKHATDVIRTGCDGMAVVSAICGQPDPEQASRDIRHAMDQTTEIRT